MLTVDIIICYNKNTMFRANENFSRMLDSYLFSEVGKRVREFVMSHPEAEIVRMDVGDVSQPLAKPVVEAMLKATREMGTESGFHGYGPEQGYPFLRDAIIEGDYRKIGINHITSDDIFVTDGAKCDIGNLCNLFGKDVKVAVCDPVYPVYVDDNALDGRAGIYKDGRWSGLTYLPCEASNGFEPSLPPDNAEIDVIYLCSPNNPTGTAMTHNELKKWVDYAIDHKALIIYDSAYVAYITQNDIVRSIFEIEGAEKCAIEVRSYSKTAGFTGVRCGYTVVPAALAYLNDAGEKVSLRDVWHRRQSTKFNGVGYIVQRGAEALYTAEGQAAISETVSVYMRNVKRLRDALCQLIGTDADSQVFGGINSPYVWFRPDLNCDDSWHLFERLLSNYHITSTPGCGFGSCGKGWLRLTGFNTEANTIKAVERLLSKNKHIIN